GQSKRNIYGDLKQKFQQVERCPDQPLHNQGMLPHAPLHCEDLSFVDICLTGTGIPLS
ncbi:hypothetical protein SK128_028533, partial [Halocaridina rubra]